MRSDHGSRLDRRTASQRERHHLLGIEPHVRDALLTTGNKLFVIYPTRKYGFAVWTYAQGMDRRFVVSRLCIRRGTKSYHLNAEPVCNNVPHANETALVGHDDLFLLVTRQCRTHLIRVQHTTVNGPARFDVQRASRRPNVPDLALLVVTGCVHPLPVTAESDLVDGGLVCFWVRILRWLTERTNYLRTLSIRVHLVYFE